MLFKTFDLKNIIKKYNVFNNTNHLEESSFGFKYFENTNLEILNKLIDTINNAHQLCLYTEQEAKLVKYLNKGLRDVKNEFDGSIHSIYSKLRDAHNKIPFTQEKIASLWRHSERYALVYGLMTIPKDEPIIIINTFSVFPKLNSVLITVFSVNSDQYLRFIASLLTP